MLEKFNPIKLFSKKSPINIEQKATSPWAALLTPNAGMAFPFATNNVKWMQYYSNVAPLGDAINKIANKAAPIDLMLFAPDKNEASLPVTEHPFLKLLNRPNRYQTKQQFVREAITFERATGNYYLQVVGGISADKTRFVSEPVEMYNLRPDFINSVTPDPKDGRALYYQYTKPNGDMITFNRIEARNVQNKLIDIYVDASGASMLYVFKNVASRTYSGFYNLFGDPPAKAAELQIGQYFEAAVYNYFLIVNGLSARKLISLDSKTGEVLTQAQKDQLEAFIIANFSGATASGKSIVAGLPLKVEDLQIALKDMDFKNLYENATQTIYRALNIPLPLVSNDHTSMNNMDISTMMFFDDGVLPPLSSFCDNLFTFLFTDRYKDATQFLYLGYNEASIGALQPRMAKNLKLQKEAGVSTINEMREYQGLGRVEGGDAIYMPGTMVAIGTDTNLRDTIGVDAPNEDDAEARRAAEKSALRAFLEGSKKSDGTPIYNKEQINILAG